MYVSLSIYIAIPAIRATFFKETGETVHRCSNGHIGTLEAKFCQECGQKFQAEAREEYTEMLTEVCTKQGWNDPAAGFSALLGNGWLAKCAGTEGPESLDVFQIQLVPINVEAASPDGKNLPQVFGLGIKIGGIGGLGEDRLTDKVMEIPLDGFPKQSAALKEVAAMLGIEGEPALYPQVTVSY